jgi:subtilase family protein
MCDTIPGELILSHHGDDVPAAELVDDIRNGQVEHVSYVESFAERLALFHEAYELPWSLHRLRVPEGQELWKINFLHSLYTIHLLGLLGRGGSLPPSMTSTRDLFTVVPNSWLRLCAPVDFTFSPEHSTYQELLGLDRFRAHPGASTGSGVSVAIVDSGVEAGSSLHVVKTKNMVDPTALANVDDDIGHGTAVASIIHDVAPDADLWIFKVAKGKDPISEWVTLAALVAVRRASIINLSIAFGLADSTCARCGRESHSSRCAVFENVLDYVLGGNDGLLIVAAAGNGGKGALDFPARFGGVMAIGSIDSAKARSDFSNYGAKAAGGSVHDNLFFLPGGRGVGSSSGVPEYVGTTKAPSNNLNGTSFAAAYASGALALMLSSTTLMPGRGAVLKHLQDHSSTKVVGYTSGDHGHGLMIVEPMS